MPLREEVDLHSSVRFIASSPVWSPKGLCHVSRSINHRNVVVFTRANPILRFCLCWIFGSSEKTKSLVACHRHRPSFNRPVTLPGTPTTPSNALVAETAGDCQSCFLLLAWYMPPRYIHIRNLLPNPSQNANKILSVLMIPPAWPFAPSRAR